MADLYEALRRRLVELVTDGSFTQGEIAAYVGVAQAHVSNFMGGRRGISFEFADRVLNFAGLTIEDLVADGAIQEHTRFQQRQSDKFREVPVVSIAHCVRPDIQTRHFQRTVMVGNDMFAPVSKNGTRRQWLRAIACEHKGELLVIDRLSINPGRGRFVAWHSEELWLGRFISSIRGGVFCPQRSDRDPVPGPLIVGKVVEIRRGMECVNP